MNTDEKMRKNGKVIATFVAISSNRDSITRRANFGSLLYKIEKRPFSSSMNLGMSKIFVKFTCRVFI